MNAIKESGDDLSSCKASTANDDNYPQKPFTKKTDMIKKLVMIQESFQRDSVESDQESKLKEDFDLQRKARKSMPPLAQATGAPSVCGPGYPYTHQTYLHLELILETTTS
ncbi:uncharacterized protein BDZ99DRAFT_93040 [Mytilinidion resinicola]|uniref:Uncharacterized protein n=1 Tax=Mytilinidion resinicola TaxID=574789 RepID=A0A6A6YC25_9PEZI|nr:uncharacterized protein BDZ99DRAFT_93040 [Mytilinidion resinicola]KAF2806260.1 hypothetical protein BDZ99DRAFT_93040 [Mytilinidion resinicola]